MGMKSLSTQNNLNWIYLSAVALIGILTAMLVPALSGQPLHPQAVYYSACLATASFAGIWWYRGKNAWLGAGLGSILGLLLYLLALAVSNLV